MSTPTEIGDTTVWAANRLVDLFDLGVSIGGVLLFLFGIVLYAYRRRLDRSTAGLSISGFILSIPTIVPWILSAVGLEATATRIRWAWTDVMGAIKSRVVGPAESLRELERSFNKIVIDGIQEFSVPLSTEVGGGLVSDTASDVGNSLVDTDQAVSSSFSTAGDTLSGGAGFLGGIADGIPVIGDEIAGGFDLLGGALDGILSTIGTVVGLVFGVPGRLLLAVSGTTDLLLSLNAIELMAVIVGLVLILISLLSIITELVGSINLVGILVGNEISETISDTVQILFTVFVGVLFVLYGFVGFVFSVPIIGVGFTLYWISMNQDISAIGTYSVILMVVGFLALFVGLGAGPMVTLFVYLPVSFLGYLWGTRTLKQRAGRITDENTGLIFG